MSVSRRRLMGGAAAGAAAAAFGPGLKQAAAQDAAPMQLPGFYRRRVGDAMVTIVSDGGLELPVPALALNAPEGALEAEMVAYGLPTDIVYAHTNAVVVDTGGQRVLIDTGYGRDRVPTAGLLSRHLQAAGIPRDSIDKIALTHAHPDHLWGMVDGLGSVFRDIPLFLTETEWSYWADASTPGSVDAARRQMTQFTYDALMIHDPVKDLIGNDQEIAPGLRCIETPGHTPGHAGYLLTSGSDSLFIAGDLANHAIVFFAHPDWIFAFDMDGQLAAETRRAMFDRLAADQIPTLLYHAPFPGIGRITHTDTAYRFNPEPIRWQI